MMGIRTITVTTEQANKFWLAILWATVKDGVKMSYVEGTGKVELSYDGDCIEHLTALVDILNAK